MPHALLSLDKPAAPPEEAGACPRPAEGSGLTKESPPSRTPPGHSLCWCSYMAAHALSRKPGTFPKGHRGPFLSTTIDRSPGSPWSLEVGAHGSGCSALSGHAMALCPWPRSLRSICRSPAEVNQQRVRYPSVANQSPISSMGLEIIRRSRGVGTRGARVGAPQEGREGSGSRGLGMELQEPSLENL